MKFFTVFLILIVPLTGMAACDGDKLVIKYVGWYYDGGTLGVAISDSGGCLVEFCFDHGLTSKNKGKIIVGSRSPTGKSAKVASSEETLTMISLIKAALDKVYPADVQNEFLKMPVRNSIPQDDYYAWLLLRELRGRGDI